MLKSEFENACKNGRLNAKSMVNMLHKRSRTNNDFLPIIWVEVTGCSGNTISIIDSLGPNLSQVLMNIVTLYYSNTLMWAQNEAALKILKKALYDEDFKFSLIVEGAIATGTMARSTMIAIGDSFSITAEEAIKTLGKKAEWVLAFGTCASFGGPSAANPNPTNSVPAQKLIDKQVIKVPGCPAHPDWMVGTLSNLLLYGQPEVDTVGRPLLFYEYTIHKRCPRRSYFDQGIFAQNLGDDECMFELGCKGPITYADCPVRQWNGYVNWPVGANTPCIGCASEGFPDQTSPFFSPLPPRKPDEQRPKQTNKEISSLFRTKGRSKS